ncbi:MAG: N-acyl homoserine lactonase family protein [Rhodospirillaceae bacterium]|jgi:glyoxylase-like metal-dependent hydrolase (beta-lactamase superfamily II)|nr:N-acyl homoserine lactonase family protein [Rhodospirillaceae bacterium]MBT5193463.1 N-acyl homoserine lactonase family protein [Rhodospirillaceae bacterium]MBT5896567.1 N-acyl homoserine lactonase family protein [Rhodospirillaceae bacterium]MBT6429188.1 N-acyl homoserine lactonase family protein [Rhodospirillaceae bacterium]MBT7759359.1 N-acyl homoserine lactonase family protein [Rhodospirillaceae bacterium]
MSEDTYEIYAIKYGDRVGERGTMFVHGDPHDAPIAMDYFIWALRNDQRTIVVDVGYGQAEGEGRGRSFLRSPTEGLALLDINASEVEDVIITHMHYDHAGNLEQFPKARFHIQDVEMSLVTGRAMTHKALRHSFVVDDVVDMVRLVYGDRVVFHDGEDHIAPGVSVHHLPGHTRGMQAVRVGSQRGAVVLASDVAHYYESFELETPFMTHEDLFQMLESHRKLRALASDNAHIVPGHDPLVMQRYPAPRADLEGIVVRLDVPPKDGMV